MNTKNILILLLLTMLTACDLEVIPDIEVSVLAIFEVTPNSCNYPCAISIDNKSPTNENITFKWDFGDGSGIHTGQNPENNEHVYELPGTYTITLELFVNDIFKSSITESVTIIDPLQAPIAGFEVLNDGCFAPCIVVFDNTSINASRLIWRFDDATEDRLTTAVDTVHHKFKKAGVYHATLIAINEDANGEKRDTFEMEVTVKLRTFTSTHSNLGTGRAVFQLSDQSYIVVGHESGGNHDYFVTRTVAGGSSVIKSGFPKTIPFDLDLNVTDAILLRDSTIAILGTTYLPDLELQRMVYLRIDLDGNASFPPKIMFDSNTDVLDKDIIASKLIETQDGDVVLLGTAKSITSDRDIYFRRIDRDAETGSISSVISGAGTDNIQVTGIARTGDDFVIIANKLGAEFAATITITDENGIPTNTSFPRFLDNNHISTNAIAVKRNGNFLICGINSSFEVYLAEYASSGFGSALMSTTVQTNGSIKSIVSSHDNKSFILVGKQNNQASIIGFNENGTEFFDIQSHGNSSDSQFSSGQQTVDCGWVATGFSVNASTLLLIKMDKEGKVQ